MPTSVQSNFRNRLLSLLSQADFDRLSPFLEAVHLPIQFTMSSPDRPSDYTYFPESGIGSIILHTTDRAAETSLFGHEGMAPTGSFLGVQIDPFTVLMQVGGTGHRILNARLHAASDDSPTLRTLLSRYVHTVLIQSAHTALSNASYTIDQRLARWILMCHDRIEDDTIPLTHKMLSNLLTVRRQSVTTTLHILEGRRVLSSSRGAITVRDRVVLEEFAGVAYGLPEREYAKLFGAIRQVS